MKTVILVPVVALSIVAGFVPADAATLFGIVDTGELFTSDDGGASWNPQSTLPVSDAVAIAAGETSDELFMATTSGSIYRSSDGGTSWMGAGVVPASDVVDMAIRNNGDIYLLSKKGSLWLSDDDGATFTAIATLPASNHVSLAGDVGGGHLYVLTETGEVARSSDFGTTWDVVGAVTTPDAVAIRPMGLVLYVLTGTGDVAKSADAGATWVMVGTISQVHMTGLTTDGTNFAAVTREGLIATSGDAVNWSFVGSINQLDVVAIGNDIPTITGVRDQGPAFSRLRVRSLWPNPARGDGDLVSVMLETAGSDEVAFELYDVAGRLVGRREPREFAGPGVHTAQWDVGNLASGVYLVRLTAASGASARTKLTVIH